MVSVAVAGITVLPIGRPPDREQDTAPPFEELAADILSQTIEQLRDAYPAARDTFALDDTYFLALLFSVDGSEVAAVPCRTFEIAPDTSWMAPLTTPAGPVNYVVTWDPALRLSSGLGVNSTLGNIRQVFGQVAIRAVEFVGWYAVVVRDDAALGLRFRLTRFDGSALFGWDNWDEYDYALKPELVPDSARVDQVWINARCPER
jgi:hypothetical protein